MSHDPHRDAIIARRALYLSAALAALGCNTPKDKPVAVSATASSGRAEAPPPQAPWSRVLAQAPPRSVPASAGSRERPQLELLNKQLDGHYRTVEALWNSAPRCAPAEADCREWEELANRIAEVRHAFGDSPVGACSGTLGFTHTLVARRAAHRRYLASLLAQLEAHLGRLAEAHGPEDDAQWERLVAKANEPRPLPCLSPCRVPDVEDVIVAVAFDENDATLRADQAPASTALSSVLAAQQRHGKKARLIVRGHADPHEKNADELAKRRAEAVAAWLIGKGIPADELETRSLKADLPIEPAGAGANRRVDFEVIPR